MKEVLRSVRREALHNPKPTPEPELNLASATALLNNQNVVLPLGGTDGEEHMRVHFCTPPKKLGPSFVSVISKMSPGRRERH